MPDRFNLHACIAPQNVGHHGPSFWPRGRHSGPRTILLRITHITVKPVASQPPRHSRHVERLNSGCRILFKGVTFDARQCLVTNHQSRIGFDTVIGFWHHNWSHRFLQVTGDQSRYQSIGCCVAKLRHPRRHVGPIFRTLVQNRFEPGFVEFVAGTIQSWRHAAFITHFRNAADKNMRHRFGHTANAAPRMTGVAIHREQDLVDLTLCRCYFRRGIHAAQRQDRRRDIVSLTRAQDKVRDIDCRLFREATAAGFQVGELRCLAGPRNPLFAIAKLMAGSTTQRGE